ncbi:MAG: methylated-DNA--[protein]-cysteine S-methyltransferase [Alphaproteobacteria bacterium]
MDHAITIKSPVGPLTITARDGAIVALDFGAGGASRPRSPLLAEAKAQLAAYFSGRLRTFTLPLAPHGTSFQCRVWAAMQTIPFGRTATYGELADRLRSSARAVGGACGRNPIPIIIPCHRVLARHGPGGYSGAGGLRTKRALLGGEGVTLGGRPL